MPDIVTKYPQVLMKELKDAGGKCGDPTLQKRILVKCPTEQFCVLPTGEICVYGLNQISQVSQVSKEEWYLHINNVPGMFSAYNIVILLVIFGLGILLGDYLKRRT